MAKTAEDMGSIHDVEETETDVTETDDGGAIVRDEESAEGADEEATFYDNIVDVIPSHELETYAIDLIEAIERDKKARQRRDQEYAEAVKRTGLGKEAPGGADFDGASKAVHPVLMESSVDFAARAVREIMPGNGPVKVFIPGDEVTQKRLEKAERKKTYMNFQFTVQMPEFRSELEQLLTQLAIAGSQYMRLTPDWSKRRARAVPQYVPSDKVHIPYSASNFYTAERQTFEEEITKIEFEARVKEKMYTYDLPRLTNPQSPTKTEAEKATDKIEGKTETDYYNHDGLRTVYECSTFLDLEEHGLAPYIVSIDVNSRKIVSVLRNWEEDDEDLERMQWMVEFAFVPWRGAYSIGLGQMIGSLAGAATGALRALLDSAHMNNLPTLLKLKGANLSGQSKESSATQVVEVDGGIATDADIRRLIMNVPFNEPSAVLMQLLGFCVDAAKGVVRTTFEDLAEQKRDLPVGTTLALIEEGMKVISAIHLRLYHAMTYVIRIMHRINKMYLTEDEVKSDTGSIMAYRSDFQDPVDVVPTADPEIFSDVQRMAQIQVIADRAMNFPQLYNLRETEKLILERTKIPNYERLLLPEQKAEYMNAVNENAAMVMGRPVAAFPDQDHVAHLEVLVGFMLSPLFGGMQNIAPTFMPMAVDHIKEHLALWYVSEFYKVTRAEMAPDAESEDEADEVVSSAMKEKDGDTRKEMDRLFADLSPDVLKQAEHTFDALPDIVNQAIQIIQQFQQPPQLPVDPNAKAETDRKAADDQRKAQLKGIEIADKKEIKFAELSADGRQLMLAAAQDEQAAAAERVARMQELVIGEAAEEARLGRQLTSEEKRNLEDNMTAMRIAAAEVEAGKDTQLQTGKGINPGA